MKILAIIFFSVLVGLITEDAIGKVPDPKDESLYQHTKINDLKTSIRGISLLSIVAMIFIAYGLD